MLGTISKSWVKLESLEVNFTIKGTLNERQDIVSVFNSTIELNNALRWLSEMYCFPAILTSF